MSSIEIHHDFLGNSNLEFTFFPSDNMLSEKILYRSFGNHERFKNKILDHFLRKVSDSNIKFKIEKIFAIPEVQNLVFHMGEDISTGRTKFYISLYNNNFKINLSILSKLKNILDIDSYSLERDFYKFDCVGFDITTEGINMKVYELVQIEACYTSLLPIYIDTNNIKEVGFLKSGKRKKLFFRFSNLVDIGEDSEIYKKIIQLQEKLGTKYALQGKLSYYCLESSKEEIYFV